MENRNKVHELLGIEGESVPVGGIVRFGTTPEVIEEILALQPDLRDDRQNESPTMVEFVELGKRYQGSKLDGYVVLPPRMDERVSVEAIRIPWESLTKEGLYDLACMAADEFSRDGEYLRLWWD